MACSASVGTLISEQFVAPAPETRAWATPSQTPTGHPSTPYSTLTPACEPAGRHRSSSTASASPTTSSSLMEGLHPTPLR